MPRRVTTTPTDLELEILKVLWEHGPSSVKDVQQGLLPERDLAYTTIATMLTIMVGKGYVKRHKVGGAALHEATIARETAEQSMLHDMVARVFGGSVAAVMQQLVDTSDLNADELLKIRQLVNRKVRETSK